MITNPKDRLNGLNIEKRAFINGQFIDARGKQVIHKASPIDGSDISGIAACQQEDIDLAVAAARDAYNRRVWCDLEPRHRGVALLGLADKMEMQREELAILDTFETGRCLKNYYLDSIPKAIEAIRWFAEAVDKFFDYATPMRARSFATVTKVPLGVVALITPWNDPLVVAAWKFAPALLMGNSVVIKPAEQSSLSILKVAQLAKEVGIPDGVFNVVPGYGETAGEALALHPDVDAVFFTGSSEIGKQILQYAGRSNMKKVGLECGGKSPFIITRKCRCLPEAAAVLAKNIFYNQGQICSAPSRLILEKGIKESFLPLLLSEAVKYVPGDPWDMQIEVGCVVSRKQQRRIEAFIEQGKASGARVVAFDFDTSRLPKGCHVVPTIFDQVDPHSNFARQEIFGPVLSLIEVDSVIEALTIANDSHYGLAASIWTNDIDEAYHFSRRLEAGIVHINSYGDDDNAVPFGGIKESGVGKDKSIFAFEEYSTTKTVWMRFGSVF